MKPEARLTHEFVEFIPSEIKTGVLYISVFYATAVHKCVCGCGHEVVTPLSPTDWRLIFDGKHISLEPSIGNWSFPCKSHYFITKDRIEWASHWSQDMVNAGRSYDALNKESYYNNVEITDLIGEESTIQKADLRPESIWDRVKSWIFKK